MIRPDGQKKRGRAPKGQSQASVYMPLLVSFLDDYPTPSAVDFVNNWNYAKAFPDEIEVAVRENNEALQTWLVFMQMSGF